MRLQVVLRVIFAPEARSRMLSSCLASCVILCRLLLNKVSFLIGFGNVCLRAILSPVLLAPNAITFTVLHILGVAESINTEIAQEVVENKSSHL